MAVKRSPDLAIALLILCTHNFERHQALSKSPAGAVLTTNIQKEIMSAVRPVRPPLRMPVALSAHPGACHFWLQQLADVLKSDKVCTCGPALSKIHCGSTWDADQIKCWYFAGRTNKDGDWGGAHERADDNAEAVRAVGRHAALKVLLLVHKAWHSTAKCFTPTSQEEQAGAFLQAAKC